MLMDSEIDAATIALPVAKTGGFRTLGAANFERRLRHVACGRRHGRAVCGADGGIVRGIYVGRGIRHGVEFCQNRHASTP